MALGGSEIAEAERRVRAGRRRIWAMGTALAVSLVALAFLTFRNAVHLGDAGVIKFFTPIPAASGCAISPWTTVALTLLVFSILGSLMILIGWALITGGGAHEFVRRLRHSDFARGVLTYFYACTTVGMAAGLVLAGLTTEGCKEQLQYGKDILGLMLGVLGTMVGFYFGSGKRDNLPDEDHDKPRM